MCTPAAEHEQSGVVNNKNRGAQAPAGEFEAQRGEWVANGRVDDAGLIKAAARPPRRPPPLFVFWDGDAVGTLVLMTL